MTVRYVSDLARANWSTVIAMVAGVGAVGLLVLTRPEPSGGQGLDLIVPFYLFSWPVFVACYLLWTHLVYASQDPRGLNTTARRESRSLRRWWARLFFGGASTWT
ncbi:MAG: hypothetical protein M3Y46_07835, partial [Actinomycetota bacterium]|nr:hypothetical protein [Actinomycetota bacterium]